MFDIHELIKQLEKIGEKDVRARTIHYYASKDLLRPIGFGRNAKYDESHVQKYKLIRLLQLRQHSLQQIREQIAELQNMDDIQSAIDLLERRQSVLSSTASNDVHAESFEEPDFWQKLDSFAIAAGVKVSYCALLAYYFLAEGTVKSYERVTVIAAISYFIAPMDAIPDMLPGLGYNDDIGALLLVVSLIGNSLNEQVKDKATQMLNKWFANYRPMSKEVEEINQLISRGKKQ